MHVFNFREIVERVKGLSAYVNEDVLVRFYLESKGRLTRKQHPPRVERELRAKECGGSQKEVLQTGPQPFAADFHQQHEAY